MAAAALADPEAPVAADDLRLARLALLEMCNGVTRWFSPKGPTSLEDVADAFADLALGMVRARHRRRALKVSDLKLPPKPSKRTDSVALLVEDRRRR